MQIGRAPFPGDRLLDTIAGTLEREPKWNPWRRSLLERNKIYVVIRGAAAESEGDLRVGRERRGLLVRG